MILRTLATCLSLAIVSLTFAARTSTAADYANTAWTPSAVVSTTGSGTLNAIAVTIGTAAAGDNYGKTFDQDWDTINFVNAAGFTNVTPSGGIALGYSANTSTTQNISFGGAGITNPYYLVNWTETGTSITFPQTPSYFTGSQANLVGNVVTITATESADVGFIVGFTGTFTSLNFVVNRTGGNETLAFTVAAVPVPEPSTYALGTLAAAIIAWLARRRNLMARV